MGDSEVRYRPGGDDYENTTPSKRKSMGKRDELIASEETVPRSSIWFYGLGIILCIGLVIILLIAVSVQWGQWGTYRNYMQNAISEITGENTYRTDTRNMISLSALASSASNAVTSIFKRKAFCYTDILRGDTDDGRGTLTPVIDQLTNEKDPFYYAFNYQMTMEFDVDVNSYVQHGGTLEKDAKYMIIAYHITSSYTHISTIKLIERALIVGGKTLRDTNEIYLCSDVPAIGARSCTEGGVMAGEDARLFVKHSLLVPITKIEKLPGPDDDDDDNSRNSSNNARATRAPTTRSANHGNVRQYDITHKDPSMTRYKAEEDFTKDIRLYNVIVYHAPRPEKGDRYGNLKETVAFSFKVNKCQ